MGTPMSPSRATPITPGQIGKIQELLAATLRKSNGLKSHWVQRVLEARGQVLVNRFLHELEGECFSTEMKERLPGPVPKSLPNFPDAWRESPTYICRHCGTSAWVHWQDPTFVGCSKCGYCTGVVEVHFRLSDENGSSE
jgi:hypothetical protein